MIRRLGFTVLTFALVFGTLSPAAVRGAFPTIGISLDPPTSSSKRGYEQREFRSGNLPHRR